MSWLVVLPMICCGYTRPDKMFSITFEGIDKE